MLTICDITLKKKVKHQATPSHIFTVDSFLSTVDYECLNSVPSNTQCRAAEEGEMEHDESFLGKKYIYIYINK